MAPGVLTAVGPQVVTEPWIWAIGIVLIAVGLGTAGLRPAWIVRHAGVVVGVLGLLSVAALVALVDVRVPTLRIAIDPSEEPMLPAAAPTRPIYAEAIRNFGDDDLFVIAMHTRRVFTADNLLTLRRIGNEIRRLPGVRGAESVVETTAYKYDARADVVDVGMLIDEIPESPIRLASLRVRATMDRIFPKTIISRNATTAAINVSFRTMTDGEFVEAELDEKIRAIVDTEANPDREFFVTGRKHIKARAYRLMVRDLVQLIPLAVIVGAAVGWIVSGSLRAAVVPVGASLMATLWVFGALAYQARPLNLITIVLGPMLICVGSVYGVHVMARFDAFLAEYRDRQRAALECLRYTFTPVLIAGLTTCIGFSALLISDTPAIAELGGLSVLGVMATTLISVTGIPALLSRLPARSPGDAGESVVMRRLLVPLLDRTAAFTTRRPRAAVLAWGVLVIGAVVMIPRTVVDTDYLTFFDRQSPERRDFAAISDLIVGAVPIYVTLASPTGGAFREPGHLRAVERLQQRIDALPGVSATLSVVDLVEVLNRVVEKGDPQAERIPDTRGEVADILFLIPKNKLRRFANADHSRVNIVVRTGTSGSAAILALERRLHEAVAATDLPPDVTVEVTGNAIVVNNAADGVARDQVTSVGVAAIAIFLLITAVFRSARLGMLAMIPNIVPVLMFFGLLGAGVAVLSLPTSLIGCIALGIAIDDTAHFLVAYRTRRRGGASPEDAATYCIRTLGRPIVTTSLMLIGGFLVLYFSKFATLREFGYLSSITMLICLAADLVLLPALLLRARA